MKNNNIHYRKIGDKLKISFPKSLEVKGYSMYIETTSNAFTQSIIDSNGKIADQVVLEKTYKATIITEGRDSIPEDILDKEREINSILKEGNLVPEIIYES